MLQEAAVISFITVVLFPLFTSWYTSTVSTLFDSVALQLSHAFGL